jgi:G3E family GTPase
LKVLLFGGFLGSGKTTLLLQVAKYITERLKETVVIIENEIGEAGIDDKLFSDSGLKVRPLFGGCVCCQITSDLVAAVQEIQEKMKPDWLLIEMTGLAIPENVAKLLTQYCHFFSGFKTVTLVDMARWTELMEVLEPVITGQVKKAGLIIVNKVDAGETAQDEVTGDLRAIADDGTPIIFTCAAVQLPDSVIEEVIDFE